MGRWAAEMGPLALSGESYAPSLGWDPGPARGVGAGAMCLMLKTMRAVALRVRSDVNRVRLSYSASFQSRE